ncbi:ricin B lectin domain-containing protein [Cercophora newfieldiana]|uniref:Ricin B lectin domain-containing protein n=1 Tax=Cercophora newfieldiana TaxID=92897 RepID=A0AA40CV29_9PEZI|nr:ricin B lectin domain-containing protein [Cercophora newfieldiana]
MLSTSIFLVALAATGFAQVTPPEGYRKVYMTSNVNTKFVVQPKTPVKAGNTLVVQTLSSKPEQQWWLQNGKTKIQLVDTTLCMDAGAKSAWKDMANIAVNTCSDTADGQKWEVKADGRIALELSPSPQQCIDLQYMRATANNPVGLYTCAGLGNTGAADKGINWPLVNVTA